MQFLNWLLFTLSSVVSSATALNTPAMHPRDFLNVSPRAPETLASADQCHDHGNVCAEFFIGNRVSQVFRTNENGCAPVVNPSAVTALKVYDCWCGLWWATSTTACNNGDDERVDSINQCAGLVKPTERGWKKMPTHVGCFRS